MSAIENASAKPLNAKMMGWFFGTISAPPKMAARRGLSEFRGVTHEIFGMGAVVDKAKAAVAAAAKGLESAFGG